MDIDLTYSRCLKTRQQISYRCVLKMRLQVILKKNKKIKFYSTRFLNAAIGPIQKMRLKTPINITIDLTYSRIQVSYSCILKTCLQVIFKNIYIYIYIWLVLQPRFLKVAIESIQKTRPNTFKRGYKTYFSHNFKTRLQVVHQPHF